MSGDLFVNRFERDQFYIAVGHRIRTTRESQEMTQQQLSTAAKLAHSTIMHAEQGRTLSVLVLAKLAEALDVTIDELVPLEATR